MSDPYFLRNSVTKKIVANVPQTKKEEIFYADDFSLGLRFSEFRHAYIYAKVAQIIENVEFYIYDNKQCNKVCTTDTQDIDIDAFEKITKIVQKISNFTNPEYPLLNIFEIFYTDYAISKTCFDGILQLGFDQYYESFKKSKYKNLIFYDDELIFLDEGEIILIPFKSKSRESLVLAKLCSDEYIIRTWEY